MYMPQKGFKRGDHDTDVDWRHFVSLPNSGEKNVRRIVVSAESLKQMKDEAKNSKEKPKPVPRSEVFAQLQAGYCGNTKDFYIPAVWWMLSEDLISVQIGTSNDGIASRVEHHQDWPLKPKERRGQEYVVWVVSTQNGKPFLRFGVCWDKQSGQGRIIPSGGGDDGGCCVIV